MEKTYDVLDGKLLVTCFEVLTATEASKLDNANNSKKLTAYAKDMHFDWAVEIRGNVATCNITRTFDGPVTDSDCHQLEIDLCNFMKFANELPEAKKQSKGQKKIDQDINPEIDKNLNFCIDILNDWDNPEVPPTIGAQMLANVGLTMPACCGTISGSLLKEMFIAYVEKYDHE